MLNEIDIAGLRSSLTAIAKQPHGELCEDEYGCLSEQCPRQVFIKRLAYDTLVELPALLDEIERLRKWNQDMVAKVAENRLDGYRELGQRAAAAEAERDAALARVKAIVGVAERFGWNGIENSKFLLSFLEDEFNELKQLRELLEGSTVRLTSPDLYAELEPEDWNAIVAALHDWCDHATNDDHFEARENLTKRLESALDRRNCPICGGDGCRCVAAAQEFEGEPIAEREG